MKMLLQESSGLLTMKFSKKLLETMQEVRCWRHACQIPDLHRSRFLMSSIVAGQILGAHENEHPLHCH